MRNWRRAMLRGALPVIWLAACGGDDGGSAPPPSPRLAFVTHRTGNDDIFLMRLDGTDSVNLTRAAGMDEEPAWSPDGGAIAFVSDRSGHFEVWVMDTLGGHQTQLTNSPGNKDRPSWSPDGSQIVYARNDTLFIMMADGSGAAPVPHSEGAEEPAWSPDGHRIAFTSGGYLYLIDPDGENARRVTSDSLGPEAEPAWSPDGGRLAFFRLTLPGDSYFVNVIDTSGAGELNLTRALASHGVASSVEPAWSPDGKTIAFTCDIPPVQDGHNFELCLVHPDGSHFANLTQTVAPEHWAAWAP